MIMKTGKIKENTKVYYFSILLSEAKEAKSQNSKMQKKNRGGNYFETVLNLGIPSFVSLAESTIGRDNQLQQGNVKSICQHSRILCIPT